MFNDDIQGTGAVILSGFINAVKLSGVPVREQRLLFYGAGSAGVGVAVQLRDHLMKAGGMSEEEANAKFWLMDTKGGRARAPREPKASEVEVTDRPFRRYPSSFFFPLNL